MGLEITKVQNEYGSVDMKLKDETFQLSIIGPKGEDIRVVFKRNQIEFVIFGNTAVKVSKNKRVKCEVSNYDGEDL